MNKENNEDEIRNEKKKRADAVFLKFIFYSPCLFLYTFLYIVNEKINPAFTINKKRKNNFVKTLYI